MNDAELRELVEAWTGVTLPEKPDPFYQWRIRDNSIMFSVSDLTWDFKLCIPDSRQLFEGLSLSKHTGIQLHRVMDAPGVAVHYRLCSAMKGSDYEAFIVGWATLTTPKNHRKQVNDYLDRAKACTRR